jgi:hypothetical protein
MAFFQVRTKDGGLYKCDRLIPAWAEDGNHTLHIGITCADGRVVKIPQPQIEEVKVLNPPFPAIQSCCPNCKHSFVRTDQQTN